MANFCDQLIFMIGGQPRGKSEPCSEVFFYRVKTNAWISAPALNYARWGHSSCFLGDSLFVYGDSLPNIPIERLSNVSGSLGSSPDESRWEAIQLNSLRDATYVLMVPQIHSETILILGKLFDFPNRPCLNSFTLDPKKMAKEEATSYPDYSDHVVSFISNQYKISNHGRRFVTVAQDNKSLHDSSIILIEFDIADN